MKYSQRSTFIYILICKMSFALLPQDILQWEINKWLTAGDRVSFNMVLQADERVYKKFDRNFAEKHSLAIACKTQRKHAQMINRLTPLAINLDVFALAKGPTAIEKYALFLMNNFAAPLFAYQTKSVLSAAAAAVTLKTSQKCIAELESFLADDCVYKPFMQESTRSVLVAAIKHIRSTKVVKTI